MTIVERLRQLFREAALQEPRRLGAKARLGIIFVIR